MGHVYNASRRPPPQAYCFSCGELATLTARARYHGRFRCPLCRADNRVGPDGQGQPLRGAAQRVVDMPQVACPRCRQPNRVPYPLVRAGRYTCCHCHAVAPLPAVLRRAYGLLPGWLGWLVAALVVVLCSGSYVVVRNAWSELRATAAGAAMGGPFEEGRDLRQVAPPEVVFGSSAGTRYECQVAIRNPFQRPVTCFVRAQLRAGERDGWSRTVTVRNLRPGEQRRVGIIITDPSRGPADGVLVSLAGIR